MEFIKTWEYEKLLTFTQTIKAISFFFIINLTTLLEINN